LKNEQGKRNASDDEKCGLKSKKGSEHYLKRCTHNRPPASTDNHHNRQLLRLHTRAAAAVAVAIDQGGKSRVLVQLVPDTT